MAVQKEILLVSPVRVLETLVQLVQQGSFWASALSSLGRVLLGFSLAVTLGLLLAVVTCRYRWADMLFSPLLSLVKATPVASFILLALVWIQTGGVPVFISFLMVLPIIWANVQQGIRQIDPGLMEMARVYQLPRQRQLTHIMIPSVMPYFMSAFSTGMGFAWKSGIAAEVICLPKVGIGYWLYQAKIYLETPSLFAWTAVIVLLSILLEKGIVRLVRLWSDRYQLD